ncbi:MAG: starch-binding protein [Clostridia bacterium]|nr:starch-binding protein [Clostridia bacterium]
MSCKKVISFVLLLCILISSFAIPAVSAGDVSTVKVSASEELAEVGANYGLAKNIQDGNILHCFNWKYSDIKAELKNIAEAGFTSVQTSPAQPAGSGEWYWLYQPYGFYIGNNALGSKNDLQSLCTEADKYGIKVIVDVVANHLNGDTYRVQSDLQDNQYWHSLGYVSNWADRYQVVNGEIGMRDLNSEHSYVQQVVAKYMKELESVGVDGIRWDAAKHIALPSEGCNFWPSVTKNNNMWHYGEILVGPDDRGSGNEHLMKEYTNYMSVTDSSYGATLRNSFAGGSATSSIGNWSSRGVAENKLVYWAESHDTYSNGPDDWGASTRINQNSIDRAYAVAASRSGANALYFSRPGSMDKSSIRSGQKGSTDFKNKQVAAVNQLKNECVGEKDYMTTGSNCTVICRESGAVIVAGNGSNFSVSVPNGGGTTKPGTYKDLVSGSTWTVTSSTISGQIGSSGIAVICNPKPAGPSASVTPGSQNYKTDTLSLTLNFDNATSGQYSVDGGAYQNFSNGQKITIGSGVAFGTTTKVSVKASNGSATSGVETYTYTKVDPSATGIYFDNSSKNWNQVYCYIYKDGNTSPCAWPGTKMTNEGDGLWSFEPPAGYDTCSVLFTDNNGNQVPGANEPGLEYSGSPMIYRNDNWEPFVPKPPIPTQPTTERTEPTTGKTEPTTQNNNGPAVYVILGDADSDGKVNIKDATIVQKSVTGLETLSEKEYFAANVDSSLAVNVKDATILQKYVAGITVSYPVGERVLYSGSADITEPTTGKTEPTKNTEADDTADTIDLTKLGGKVIALKNNSYSTPYAYSWPSGGSSDKEWPGEAMKKLGDYYYAVVPENCNMIIFSNNGSGQTADLSIPGDFAIFNGSSKQWDGSLSDVADVTKFPVDAKGNNDFGGTTVDSEYIYLKDNANWGNAYCHSWGSDGSATTWPGKQMESMGNNLYRIKLDSSQTGVVFNNGNGTQTKDLTPQKGMAYNNQSNQWESVN